MRGTGGEIRRAPRTKPPGNEQLLGRLAQALEGGLVSAEDIERLLVRGRRGTPGRPTVASVLYALGTVVVFCGLGIAYGIAGLVGYAAVMLSGGAWWVVLIAAVVGSATGRGPGRDRPDRARCAGRAVAPCAPDRSDVASAHGEFQRSGS